MESRNQAELVVASTKQLKLDGSRKATRASQPGRNTDLEGILDGGTSRGNTVKVQPSVFVCEPRSRSPNQANGLESGAASVTSMMQIYKEQQVQTEAKSRSVLERRVQSNQGSKRVTPGGSGHILTLNIVDAKAQFSKQQKSNESEKAQPISGSADVTQGDLKSPELQKHTLLANYATHGSEGEELKEELSEKSPLRTPSTKGTILMKDQRARHDLVMSRVWVGDSTLTQNAMPASHQKHRNLKSVSQTKSHGKKKTFAENYRAVRMSNGMMSSFFKKPEQSDDAQDQMRAAQSTKSGWRNQRKQALFKAGGGYNIRKQTKKADKIAMNQADYEAQVILQVHESFDKREMLETLNCDLNQYFLNRQSMTISQDGSSIGNARPSAITAPSLEMGRPKTREIFKGRDQRNNQFVRESYDPVLKRPNTQINQRGRPALVNGAQTMAQNGINSPLGQVGVFQSPHKPQGIRDSFVTNSTLDPLRVQNSFDGKSNLKGLAQLRTDLSPSTLNAQNKSAQRYSMMSNTGKIMHKRLNTSIGQQRLKKSRVTQLNANQLKSQGSPSVQADRIKNDDPSENLSLRPLQPPSGVLGFASNNLSPAQFILGAYRRQQSPGQASGRVNDSLLQGSVQGSIELQESSNQDARHNLTVLFNDQAAAQVDSREAPTEGSLRLHPGYKSPKFSDTSQGKPSAYADGAYSSKLPIQFGGSALVTLTGRPNKDSHRPSKTLEGPGSDRNAPPHLKQMRPIKLKGESSRCTDPMPDGDYIYQVAPIQENVAFTSTVKTESTNVKQSPFSQEFSQRGVNRTMNVQKISKSHVGGEQEKQTQNFHANIPIGIDEILEAKNLVGGKRAETQIERTKAHASIQSVDEKHVHVKVARKSQDKDEFQSIVQQKVDGEVQAHLNTILFQENPNVGPMSYSTDYQGLPTSFGNISKAHIYFQKVGQQNRPVSNQQKGFRSYARREIQNETKVAEVIIGSPKQKHRGQRINQIIKSDKREIDTRIIIQLQPPQEPVTRPSQYDVLKTASASQDNDLKKDASRKFKDQELLTSPASPIKDDEQILSMRQPELLQASTLREGPASPPTGNEASVQAPGTSPTYVIDASQLQTREGIMSQREQSLMQKSPPMKTLDPRKIGSRSTQKIELRRQGNASQRGKRQSQQILDEIGLVTEELQGKILAVGPSYSKFVSQRTMTGGIKSKNASQSPPAKKLGKLRESLSPEKSIEKHESRDKLKDQLKSLIKVQKQPLNQKAKKYTKNPNLKDAPTTTDYPAQLITNFKQPNEPEQSPGYQQYRFLNRFRKSQDYRIQDVKTKQYISLNNEKQINQAQKVITIKEQVVKDTTSDRYRNVKSALGDPESKSRLNLPLDQDGRTSMDATQYGQFSAHLSSDRNLNIERFSGEQAMPPSVNPSSRPVQVDKSNSFNADKDGQVKQYLRTEDENQADIVENEQKETKQESGKNKDIEKLNISRLNKFIEQGFIGQDDIPWIIGEMVSGRDQNSQCRNQNILGMQAILFDRLKADVTCPQVRLAAEVNEPESPDRAATRSMTLQTDHNKSGKDSASPSRRHSVGIALTPIPRIVVDDEGGKDVTTGTDETASKGNVMRLRAPKLYKIDCGGGFEDEALRKQDKQVQRNSNPAIGQAEQSHDYQEASEHEPSPMRKSQYAQENTPARISRSNTSEKQVINTAVKRGSSGDSPLILKKRSVYLNARHHGGDYQDEPSSLLHLKGRGAQKMISKTIKNTKRNVLTSKESKIQGALQDLKSDLQKEFSKISEHSSFDPTARTGMNKQACQQQKYLDYESLMQFFDRTHAQRKQLENQNLMYNLLKSPKTDLITQNRGKSEQKPKNDKLDSQDLSHIFNQINLRNSTKNEGQMHKIWQDLSIYHDYLDFKEGSNTQKQVIRYIIQQQLAQDGLKLDEKFELLNKLNGKYRKDSEEALFKSVKFASHQKVKLLESQERPQTVGSFIDKPLMKVPRRVTIKSENTSKLEKKSPPESRGQKDKKFATIQVSDEACTKDTLLNLKKKVLSEQGYDSRILNLQVKSMDQARQSILKQPNSPHILRTNCSQSRSLSSNSKSQQRVEQTKKINKIQYSNKSTLFINKQGKSNPSKHTYLEQLINSQKNSQNIKGGDVSTLENNLTQQMIQSTSFRAGKRQFLGEDSHPSGSVLARKLRQIENNSQAQSANTGLRHLETDQRPSPKFKISNYGIFEDNAQPALKITDCNQELFQQPKILTPKSGENSINPQTLKSQASQNQNEQHSQKSKTVFQQLPNKPQNPILSIISQQSQHLGLNTNISPTNLQESYSVRTNESPNNLVMKSINLKSPNAQVAVGAAAKKASIQKKRTAKLVDLKKQGTNDDLNQELQTPLFSKKQRNETIES